MKFCPIPTKSGELSVTREEKPPHILVKMGMVVLGLGQQQLQELINILISGDGGKVHLINDVYLMIDSAAGNEQLTKLWIGPESAWLTFDQKNALLRHIWEVAYDE